MKRFFLLLLFTPCLCATAESIRLTPSKDTDVYSYTGNPTSTSFTLGVNSTPLSDPGVHSQKSLIQFNLTPQTIPAAEIGSAVLRLFVLAPDPTYGPMSPGDLYVHLQGADWGTVTATSPKWTSFVSSGVVAILPVLSSASGTWVEVDVTSAVVAWKSGMAPNYGIFLAPQADKMATTINFTFASMEVPGYSPEIIVTRKVTPPSLAIHSTGSVVTLQWPVTGSEGWVLQRADSPAGPWVVNPATTSIVAGNHQLQPAMLTREFFRLAK